MRLHARRLLIFLATGLFAALLMKATMVLRPNLFFRQTRTSQLVLNVSKPLLSGQELIDYIANNLAVKFSRRSQGDSELSIVFTNAGTSQIPAGNWVIYFSLADALVDIARQKYRQLKDSRVIMRHIDGWMFSIEPVLKEPLNESFVALKPNETRHILHPIRLKSHCYAFPEWYVSGSGLKPRVIESTKTGRLQFDYEYKPWNPEARYNRNKVPDLNGAVRKVIPTPLVHKLGAAEIKLDPTWKISFAKGLISEASFLAGKLNLPVANNEQSSSATKVISLSMANLSSFFSNFTLLARSSLEEAYFIEIIPDRISITGQTPTGIFYGVQSLLSLLDNSKDRRSLPVGQIADAPRLEFRGLMLDVARNYIPKQKILQTLDIMAMYKLNKLHLHLSDDQGWRIEIPSLPELTEIGSRRSHDLKEEQSLLPYFGSNPSVDRLTKHEYYSVDDYQEILRHAKSRHVEIIPEIDMPGHSHAAVQSMRMRYHRLLGIGSDKATASKYLLHDLSDTSSYLAVNEHKDTVINPCLESTYTFILEVIQSLVNFHKDIEPLKTMHIGGDEVPRGALVASPACKVLITNTPQLTNNLKIYFMKRVINIANQFGVRVQAWEDGMNDQDRQPAKIEEWQSKAPIVINAWQITPAAYRYANSGYKVVLTHAHRLYLDHPYEPDVEERGLFWAARDIDSRTIFTSMFSGHPNSSQVAREETCRVLALGDCIELRHPENIIGMQASLWGEMLHSDDDIDYMVYPRLLAIAERAWHMGDWETASTMKDMIHLRDSDWTDFANTVGYKELERLERLGIKYRLPTPGIRVTGNAVDANTEFPGSIIQYSTDGGNTWTDYSKAAGEKLNASQHLRFSVVSYDMKRRGRIIGIS